MKTDSQKKIELEYRFLIPRERIMVIPPHEVANFVLNNSTVVVFQDFLFERTGTPLKDDNVGFRLRKRDDTDIEFTYKKFLGKENGMARYDEFTTKVNLDEFNDLIRGKFANPRLFMLRELMKKGELYYFLTINNKRMKFNYVSTICNAELVIEDLMYSSGKKSIPDSALEIEFNIVDGYQDKVDVFVEDIKKLYLCMDQNEGKNTRAIKLLDLSLK